MNVESAVCLLHPSHSFWLTNAMLHTQLILGHIALLMFMNNVQFLHWIVPLSLAQKGWDMSMMCTCACSHVVRAVLAVLVIRNNVAKDTILDLFSCV